MPTFHRPHQAPQAQKAQHSVRTINARSLTTSKTPGTGLRGQGTWTDIGGHIVGHSGSPLLTVTCGDIRIWNLQALL
jgi:hypothetical protein